MQNLFLIHNKHSSLPDHLCSEPHSLLHCLSLFVKHITLSSSKTRIYTATHRQQTNHQSTRCTSAPPSPLSPLWELPRHFLASSSSRSVPRPLIVRPPLIPAVPSTWPTTLPACPSTFRASATTLSSTRTLLPSLLVLLELLVPLLLSLLLSELDLDLP